MLFGKPKCKVVVISTEVEKSQGYAALVFA